MVKTFRFWIFVLILCSLSYAYSTPDANEPEWKRFNPAESFDKIWNTINEEFWDPNFNGIDWEDAHEVAPILIEEPMVSETFKYGGTVALFAKLDGEMGLIDFKTSKAIYSENFIQLAAYWNLLVENGHMVNTVRILRVGRTEEEGFEERVIGVNDLKPHWEIFKHLREIYDLKKKVK